MYSIVKTMEDGAVLAEYRYTPNGNVHEKLYYDKGVLVFRKVIFRDVYDRPTKISYFDDEDGGEELYSATLDFKSVESNQVKDTLFYQFCRILCIRILGYAKIFSCDMSFLNPFRLLYS